MGIGYPIVHVIPILKYHFSSFLLIYWIDSITKKIISCIPRSEFQLEFHSSLSMCLGSRHAQMPRAEWPKSYDGVSNKATYEHYSHHIFTCGLLNLLFILFCWLLLQPANSVFGGQPISIRIPSIHNIISVITTSVAQIIKNR